MRKPVAPKRVSKRYVIGIDFGTLSGRALLVDLATGREVASEVHEYADGVIEQTLPHGKQSLPPDTALQNPNDYLQVLSRTIPKLLRNTKTKPEQIEGIGTDFTCCTVLPTKRDGTPLCFDRKWKKYPHAWVKLWKHHAAQPEADRINAVGSRRSEHFVSVYGGKYSSEWLFSKLLETVSASPEIYDAADRFIEAGDWIVWQMCGHEKRCLSAAGFKAMRVYPEKYNSSGSKNKEQPRSLGWTFPRKEFFASLHPKLRNVAAEKLGADYYPLGGRAGGLSPKMAKATGLLPGTPVAVGNIDAHAAVPACTVTEPGKLVMIMGTSTCHLLLGKSLREVEGICGVVKDGVVPGLWGYEAGQAGVGDLFAWYVDHALPSYIHTAAKRDKLGLHEFLQKQATELKPGESGLLALDWWNGNRSVLVDADLSGLLVGATLATKPHEIYRALIESTAFGTRKIIEAFTKKRIPTEEIYACGGLAQKNPMLMQIYADVTGRPIRIAASKQTSALGAAMHGAVAAGSYPDIQTAARRMARVHKKTYKPNPKAKPIYDELYREYSRLHDLFGRDPKSPMKVLKRIRRSQFS